MNSKRSSIMLMGAAAMMAYANPLQDIQDFPEIKYDGTYPYRKGPLTNKQKKARAKSNRAKKARRRGR